MWTCNENRCRDENIDEYQIWVENHGIVLDLFRGWGRCWWWWWWRLFARLKDLQIEGEVDGFVQRVAGDLGINKSIADPPSTHSNGTNPHRTYFHHLTSVLTWWKYHYDVMFNILVVVYSNTLNNISMISVKLLVRHGQSPAQLSSFMVIANVSFTMILSISYDHYHQNQHHR